jgi:hypothetical protein
MFNFKKKTLSLILSSLIAQGASAAAVINENFDTKQAPNGWSVVAADSGWVFHDPNELVRQLKLTSNAVSVSFADGRSELQTPTLDFTNSLGVILKFKHLLFRKDNSIAFLQVSNDGGNTWSVVKSYRGDTNALIPETIDLSALVGGKNNVKIAFVSENAYVWVVDDVVIEGQIAPTEPTNLTASLGRNSAVNLMWQSSEENSGFIIERAGVDGNFQNITPTPLNAKTFTDNGVESKTTYQYRVAAKNAAGMSAFGNPTTINTEDRLVVSYDLLVSYHDTYANTVPAKQAAIEENFKYMADAVYEMSNGTQRLRTVTIYTDKAKSDVADVIWSAIKSPDQFEIDEEGKFKLDQNGNKIPKSCWFNAYPGGRIAEKGPFKRIEHCDIGGYQKPYAQNTLQDAVYGGYTLGHEFGHYFYKLYDEYQGQTLSSHPTLPSSKDTPVDLSIMQSQAKAKLGDYRWLNFSTSVNNKGNNAQFRVYGASAWDILVREPANDPKDNGWERIFYPELLKVAPKAGEMPSLELDKAGAQEIARKELKFIWKQGALEQNTRRLRLGNQPAAVVVALDISKGVSTEQLDSVKTAVKQWIQDANVGDYVSIVTVGNNSNVVQPLINIHAEAAKDTLNLAVDAISTTNETAHLENGLQTALAQLQTAPQSYSWAVYLVTAGENAADSDPLKVLTNYQDQYVLLHTIGLSDQQSNADLLNKLAYDTYGLYWQSNGALEDIAMGLDEADQYTSPAINVTVAQQSQMISGEQTFDFYIDEGLGRINFRATYTGNLQDATLTLVDPNGYSFELPTDYCQTTSEAMIKQSICGATVDYIDRGIWQLKVKANVPTLDFNYHIQGVAKDNNSVIYAAIEATGSEKITFPQPLLVAASVGNNLPITDLTVSAILETPDGRKQPFILRDDGVAPDDQANDGMYLGKLNYTSNGLHKIHAYFSNVDNKAKYTNKGVSYSPLPEGMPTPDPFTPVNVPFTRIATTNIDVQDVPPQLATNSTGNALDGNTTTASFTNHLQTSTGKVGNGVSISGTEKIRLASTISPDKKHLGQPADILIAASYKPEGSAQEVLLFRNGDNWEYFNGQIPAVFHIEKLSASTIVEVIEAPLASLGVKGDLKVYVGYRLNNGAIIFNGAHPLQFSVK